MKSILRLIVVSTLICFSCNDNQSEKKTNPEQEKATLNQQVSPEAEITIASLKYDGLEILKSVYDAQNDIKPNKSFKFYDKDSITDFIYLRNLFPIWESDSIEFYGNIERSDIDFNNFPVNSLLIIYLNNRRLSQNQINLLQFEWQNKKEALGTVFKSGGIAFELDNQLCIYSIDSCTKDYNTIEPLDSIIKSKLQGYYSFERIITTCKSEPFERRVDL